MRRRLLVATFIYVLGGVARASAQTAPPPFILHGIVVDATGAPLAGACVTAAPRLPGPSASGVSDETGSFKLLLAPGDYTLTITANGFSDLEQPISAAADGAASRRFVLQVAGVHESVSVRADDGYRTAVVSSATKTATPLLDVPQSITVVTKELVKDQLMLGVGDVVRYVPGITYHQGENNRDQIVIRGNSSSADFFVDGVRDDVQYYRDLYNLERIEALKGPNAMIFGRGGGGGVINRVVKQAAFQPLREVTLQAGAFGHKRVSADLDQPISGALAFRVNGMFESSGSFRRDVTLDRGAINPTLTFTPDSRTKITVGYEYLRDSRVADRGITSFRGRPADVPLSTFYGNPADSHVRAQANSASGMIERQFGNVTVRNRLLVGDYDRFYQNYVPGAASADATRVTVTAYNNAMKRLNVFNQTDVTAVASTGRLRHTLLAGVEIGAQSTDNFRNTGFFDNQATAIQVPFLNPGVTTPVTFRQNATDADNHVRTNLAAAFVQDQLAVSRWVQLIGGVRLDRFDLRYRNNRNAQTLERIDNLVSPRLGMVVKPLDMISLYGSYSVSYLPSSGDQFSSLTTITRQVEPEKFDSYEAGVKWDVRPALSLTGALYRLDRTNTRSTDPNDPTRIVQTGSQRTNGCEIGLNGQLTRDWSVAGGYAYQNAFVTSATIAAAAGAQVGQVPHHTFSLWNNYRFVPRLSAGVGIVHRSDMFATIDDTVTLPGYTRADAAAAFTISPKWRLQMNVENLFDAKYFLNADSNTNISPGFPRAVRVALMTAF
jgi:catecholate siderophore receptor